MEGFSSLSSAASLLEALYILFISLLIFFSGGVFIFLVACVFQRTDTDSMFCRKLEETNVSH